MARNAGGSHSTSSFVVSFHQDNERRIQTVSKLDFMESKKYAFPSNCSLSSYSDGTHLNVYNDSLYAIHVKEYAPCVFSYYRELCGISVRSILAFFRRIWKKSSAPSSLSFSLIQISRKQKNRLLHMMRPWITVCVFNPCHV